MISVNSDLQMPNGFYSCDGNPVRTLTKQRYLKASYTWNVMCRNVKNNSRKLRDLNQRNLYGKRWTCKTKLNLQLARKMLSSSDLGQNIIAP